MFQCLIGRLLQVVLIAHALEYADGLASVVGPHTELPVCAPWVPQPCLALLHMLYSIGGRNLRQSVRLFVALAEKGRCLDHGQRRLTV